MASEPGSPTLDQLRVFLAVVEAGGFTAAARKLNRTTSVISYTIHNLESQLDVTLFDRTSSRKPSLTDAGIAVLAEARTIANGVDGLRSKVKALVQGLEAEVHLVLDVMLPTDRVIDALTAFNVTFPAVALRLHVEALGGVVQLVMDRVATLGIGGPHPEASTVPGLEHMGVGSVELIPVAHPDHPLAHARTNAPGAARDHIQLVLSDRSRLTGSSDFAVISPRTWRLADLGAKHSLLKAGVGWGNMPFPMVQEDLEAGRLVRLNLPDARRGSYDFSSIHRADTPPGPATAWLIERFRAQGSSFKPADLRTLATRSPPSDAG